MPPRRTTPKALDLSEFKDTPVVLTLRPKINAELTADDEDEQSNIPLTPMPSYTRLKIDEDINEAEPIKAKVKAKRGRKVKYHSAEERIAARRKQQQAYRQRKKDELDTLRKLIAQQAASKLNPKTTKEAK